MSDPVRVMVATPLDPSLAERLAAADPRVELLHDAALLPPERFPSDHKGDPAFERDEDGQRRWEAMLERAEVLFGVPGEDAAGLAAAMALPRVRWIQATNAGVGEQVASAGLDDEDLARVALTSSSGVHAGPLAEYSLFGLLAFAKELPRLQAARRERQWDHRPVGELRDRTVLVLGLGHVGREVARLARAFGMRTLGVRRDASGTEPNVDELHPPERLPELLPRADGVVVTLPLTDATRGLLGAREIALLPRHAVVVNVGRGAVIDEAALVAALREERIAGAALDVFETEPLPPSSPLWDLENVLISPHTVALVAAESARIVELFEDNLRRYLAGEPLRNRIEPGRRY